MVHKRFAISFYVALALLLFGCGFHLRGHVEMPSWLNHVSIIDEHAHHDLGKVLNTYFRAYNVTVVSEPAAAQYWLIFEKDSMAEQIASVSSGTAARQYELIYTVQFKLIRPKGNEVLPLTTLTVARQATLNSDRILGSTQEEELLKSEMRQEAAFQMINQISRKTAYLSKRASS